MASTRVSPLRPPGIVHHLSVPTGMLTLNPSRKIKVGRLCTREGSSQSASLRLTGLLHPLTRTHVRLLVRVSRRVEWGAHRPTPRPRTSRRTPRAASCRPRLRQRRLRWPLTEFTADWGCIPKQPDSDSAVVRQGPARRAHLSGAPFQGTWARSVAEDASDYTNAKTPDFQAGLFPAFDQTIDDLTRIEFTTACQDALASLARILANRAVTHGDQLPSDILERMGGRRFVTPSRRASPVRLGAQLALKDSMVHGFCNSHQVSHFATLFIDASRDIRCRVALDFTLQHCLQQTPPPVGESRLFS
ncbi:hypothetical protein Bca101_101476 [Brassica carinata]